MDPLTSADPSRSTVRTGLLDQPPESADPDEVYAAFTEWVSTQGIELYPAQDEAVLELVTGNHVILATPTGSGKSLVAVAAHHAALAAGRRRATMPIMGREDQR